MFDALTLLFGSPFVSVDLAMPSVARVPELHAPFLAPVVAAKSVLVVDLGSGVTLFEKSANQRLPIASLTKLMTAVVAREHYDLDTVVTVSRKAAAMEPAKAWLRPGEKITVRELLGALLIASANDAAVALAEHFPGGAEKFVAAMNQKSKALNLRQTHFVNPTGLDEIGSYSTTRDLSVIASYVLRDPLLAELVATKQKTVASLDGKTKHELHSTNKLFGSYLEIHGLKTGSTRDAGECLAAIARNSREADVLAIVLDSPNRFQEAKVLLEWANTAHKW
jgi:D-alanyl-D-alanine carboxypeptidase (penicillin-binding protein 5/6)